MDTKQLGVSTELMDMSEVSLDDKVVLLDQPKSDETHMSANEKKKLNCMNFGCFTKMISLRTLCLARGRTILFSIFVVFFLVGLPIIIPKYFHKRHSPTPPDDYTLALNKALLFFNAQKCMYLLPSHDHVN